MASFSAKYAMRRAALLGYDLLALLVVSSILLAGFAAPAYAYVDPSVMTYTIQALAGVAVALSAVAGVALRRTRKVLFKMMKIDENAGKEVDPQILRLDEDGEPIYGEGDREALELAAKREGQRQARLNKQPGWVARFLMGLAVGVVGGFMLFVSAPYEIVASNAGSLSFGVMDVWQVLAVAAVVVAVAVALVLSLLRGKAFTAALLLLATFCTACWVQSMFINDGLPSADGRTIAWFSTYWDKMLVSGIVWLALFVGSVLLVVKKPRIARLSAVAVSFLLVFVQAVGVASLLVSLQEDSSTGTTLEEQIASKRCVVTTDGMLNLSKNGNVVVLLLDYMDTVYIDEMTAIDPSALSEFAGFTFYYNSLGTMMPTNFAVPYLMTKQLPVPGVEIADYENNRYQNGTFLADVSAAGATIGLYSDTLKLGNQSNKDVYYHVGRYTENLHSMESMSINPMGTAGIMAKASMYRYAPWFVKSVFLFYTDDMNREVISNVSAEDSSSQALIIDDPAFYKDLTTERLQLVDNNGKPSFHFLHFQGGHTPWNMDENCQAVPEYSVELMQQVRGSFKMVNEFLRQMKELGVYDDATIIVMSDHGQWEGSSTGATNATSPIMFVKQAGAAHDPIVRSGAPITHEQFQATVLQALGADSSAYGESYQDVRAKYDAMTPEQRAAFEMEPRTFYWMNTKGTGWSEIEEYKIEGFALDLNNWHKTGVKWEFDTIL